MSITCPHCERRLSFREPKPGRYRSMCPRCGLRFALTISAGPDQALAVASLLADPNVATRSRPRPDDQSGRAESLGLREVAAVIFEQLKSRVNAELPTGCRADTDECVSLIESLLISGKGPQELVPEFAAAFRKNPAVYVDNPHGYFAHQAANLLAEIEPRVLKGLPKGCRLNSTECKTLLRNLLAKGTSEESLVDTFLTRVRHDSSKYLVMSSPREIAETVYGQLEARLCAFLPCKPKRTECVSAIEDLVRANTSLSDLVNSFMMTLVANSEKLLSAPLPHYDHPCPTLTEPRVRILSSSAPQTMGRPESR